MCEEVGEMRGSNECNERPTYLAALFDVSMKTSYMVQR